MFISEGLFLVFLIIGGLIGGLAALDSGNQTWAIVSFVVCAIGLGLLLAQLAYSIRKDSQKLK